MHENGTTFHVTSARSRVCSLPEQLLADVQERLTQGANGLVTLDVDGVLLRKYEDMPENIDLLQEAVWDAGRARVVVTLNSGRPAEFLAPIHDVMHPGANGCGPPFLFEYGNGMRINQENGPTAVIFDRKRYESFGNPDALLLRLLSYLDEHGFANTTLHAIGDKHVVRYVEELKNGRIDIPGKPEHVMLWDHNYVTSLSLIAVSRNGGNGYVHNDGLYDAISAGVKHYLAENDLPYRLGSEDEYKEISMVFFNNSADKTAGWSMLLRFLGEKGKSMRKVHVGDTRKDFLKLRKKPYLVETFAVANASDELLDEKPDYVAEQAFLGGARECIYEAIAPFRPRSFRVG